MEDGEALRRPYASMHTVLSEVGRAHRCRLFPMPLRLHPAPVQLQQGEPSPPASGVPCALHPAPAQL